MARNAKFRVYGRLGNAGGRVSEGTVTVDRDTGVMVVRKLRSRRKFLSNISAVADVIVARELAEDARKKRASKGRRR